jgi:hypothetical protein
MLHFTTLGRGLTPLHAIPTPNRSHQQTYRLDPWTAQKIAELCDLEKFHPSQLLLFSKSLSRRRRGRSAFVHPTSWDYRDLGAVRVEGRCRLYLNAGATHAQGGGPSEFGWPLYQLSWRDSYICASVVSCRWEFA